jgi:hypothetical protein
MINLINCTPHPINLLDGEIIEKSGIIPRLIEKEKKIESIGKYSLYQKSFGQIDNLPERKADTYYIVSALIAQACPEREDLLVPRVVRDEQGKIIGCDGFYRITSNNNQLMELRNRLHKAEKKIVSLKRG